MENYNVDHNLREMLRTRIFFSRFFQAMTNFVTICSVVLLMFAIVSSWVPIVFERIFVLQFLLFGICVAFPLMFFFIPDDIELNKFFADLGVENRSVLISKVRGLFTFNLKPIKVLLILFCCVVSIFSTFIETEARTISAEIKSVRSKISVGIGEFNKIINELNSRTDIAESEKDILKQSSGKIEKQLLRQNRVSDARKIIFESVGTLESIERSQFKNGFQKSGFEILQKLKGSLSNLDNSLK